MTKFARLEVVDGYQILFEVILQDKDDDDVGLYVRIRRDHESHSMLTYLGPYPPDDESAVEHVMFNLDAEEFAGIMDSGVNRLKN